MTIQKKLPFDKATELLQELNGPRCQCGEEKRPRQSFCRPCFYRLPLDQREALYRRMGEGYEQAHANAIEWLRRERNAVAFERGSKT